MDDNEHTAQTVARFYELVERTKALADEWDEDARVFDKRGQWGFSRLKREHADYLRAMSAEFDTEAVNRRMNARRLTCFYCLTSFTSGSDQCPVCDRIATTRPGGDDA